MHAHSPQSRGPADAPPPLPGLPRPTPTPTPRHAAPSESEAQPAARAKLSDCRFGTVNGVLMLAITAMSVFSALGLMENTPIPAIVIVIGSIVGLAVLGLFAGFVGMIAFFVCGRSTQAFRIGTGVILGLSSLSSVMQTLAAWHPANAEAMMQIDAMDEDAMEDEFGGEEPPASPARKATPAFKPRDGAQGMQAVIDQVALPLIQSVSEKCKAADFAGDCYTLAGGVNLSAIKTEQELEARVARLEDVRVATAALRDELRTIDDTLRENLIAAKFPDSHLDSAVKQFSAATRLAEGRALAKANLKGIDAQNAYLTYALDNFEHWGMDQGGRTVWSTRAHAEAFNALTNEAERAMTETARILAQNANEPFGSRDRVKLPRATSIEASPKSEGRSRTPR